MIKAFETLDAIVGFFRNFARHLRILSEKNAPANASEIRQNSSLATIKKTVCV